MKATHLEEQIKSCLIDKHTVSTFEIRGRYSFYQPTNMYKNFSVFFRTTIHNGPNEILSHTTGYSFLSEETLCQFWKSLPRISENKTDTFSVVNMNFFDDTTGVVLPYKEFKLAGNAKRIKNINTHIYYNKNIHCILYKTKNIDEATLLWKNLITYPKKTKISLPW